MSGSVRCAIYTRKSTEEGLEQDFNSLDAQREACAAYIASQRHEGWVALPGAYEDGGFSGGNTNRPALLRLFEDIKAGKIDTIVVYKIDRLTRSLADFAKMVELFDGHKVTFVSVTQQFNTTTSMGRLTLNVLLSFAQFEREISSERIRDKIAASKAKGMWMGGSVPLGYRVEDRQLKVEPKDAKLVRHIFDRYLALDSVIKVRDELNALGHTTKSGSRFFTGMLAKLLSNPTYIGKVTHKGKVHQGNHPGIISLEIWEAVQALRKESIFRHVHQLRGKERSLLAGKLFDGEGNPMSPGHAYKEGRRYRYYISQGLIQGKPRSPETITRIPGQQIEGVVGVAIRDLLKDDKRVGEILPEASLAQRTRAKELHATWAGMDNKQRHLIMRSLLARVVLEQQQLRVELNVDGLGYVLDQKPLDCLPTGNTFSLIIPSSIRPVLGGKTYLLGVDGLPPPRQPDEAMVVAVAKAHHWNHLLVTGQVESQNDLIREQKIDPRLFRRTLPLAWLAPDIVESILAGTQPVDLSLAKLYGAPAGWVEQRKRLGFAAV